MDIAVKTDSGSWWAGLDSNQQPKDYEAEAINSPKQTAALDSTFSKGESGSVLLPSVADCWHKRATLYYLQGRDDESVAAIGRTLALEPRHFGALCGLGEILRGLDEKEAALLAFRRALRLHPQLSGINASLVELTNPAGSRPGGFKLVKR